MKSFAIPNIFGNFAVMKKAIVICLILFVASCCTEKKCVTAPPLPTLHFYATNDSLTGFTNEQLLNLQIIWTAKNNFVPIDSFYYFFPQDTEYLNIHNNVDIPLSGEYIAEHTKNSLDISDYNFLIVIRKANVIDTVSGIDITMGTVRERSCNTCVFGDNYYDQSIIQSIQYYFNSTLVSNMNDSTLIHR